MYLSNKKLNSHSPNDILQPRTMLATTAKASLLQYCCFYCTCK